MYQLRFELFIDYFCEVLLYEDSSLFHIAFIGIPVRGSKYDALGRLSYQ